ncbi:hypothetical protein L6452_27913 [Arctium lappa]|uniref:Uncharacterized protein n=1 Tax=Arctium lappa TaxID=4217 RepID=A0ACB8ZW10_ARCLA|nr:hypothetical protein L6452_27913 [Arctium lappa]
MATTFWLDSVVFGSGSLGESEGKSDLLDMVTDFLGATGSRTTAGVVATTGGVATTCISVTGLGLGAGPN